MQPKAKGVPAGGVAPNLCGTVDSPRKPVRFCSLALSPKTNLIDLGLHLGIGLQNSPGASNVHN